MYNTCNITQKLNFLIAVSVDSFVSMKAGLGGSKILEGNGRPYLYNASYIWEGTLQIEKSTRENPNDTASP